VREARAQRGIAEADYYPQVDATGSATRQRASQNAFGTGSGVPVSGGTSNLFQAGFDASWELDVFGGVRRSVEAANADVQAAVEDRRNTLVTLLAEVARNYVELRGLQRQIAITNENINSQQQTVELTQTRFQAGIANDLDVARAQAQVANTRAVLPTLLNQRDAAIHRLGVLVAQPPGALRAELEIDKPMPPIPAAIPVGLPSDLLRRRPDVRRAERELAASTARIGVATSDLFPKFSLTGSLGLQSRKAGDLGDSDSRYWSIGPSVRWPIFDAGRIRANIRVQNAVQEQAAANYERTVLTSLEEVENSLSSYYKEQDRRGQLAQSVSASQRAVDLANQLYTRGLIDFLSVLESQRTLYAAQDQLSQSDRAVAANLVGLYKALGGGWDAPQ
jgi:outer membrane protein, multidrug efflux system